jgi:hypothetical protein
MEFQKQVHVSEEPTLSIAADQTQVRILAAPKLRHPSAFRDSSLCLVPYTLPERMTKNVAAWIPKAKAQLEVKEAPDWKVEKGEVLVEVRPVWWCFRQTFDSDLASVALQVHSVSVQPVDWKVRLSGAVGTLGTDPIM